MSYMHIDNLYKNQDILDFKECYAMEKIHGTSAHVRFDRETKLPSCVGEEHLGDYPVPLVTEKVTFFSGGEKHESFVALFDQEALLAKFKEILPEGDVEAYVYGEAYGGKCQGMSKTYGKELRFVAFEVKIGHSWLAVPDAEKFVQSLRLDFVHYNKILAVLSAIDAERDADSVQAIRNGMGPGHIREGIVLRPLFEVKKNSGERAIAKHKRPEFTETMTKREVDPTKRQVLEDAQAIATEWVTKERLSHVIDQVVSGHLIKEGEAGRYIDITDTGTMIKAMIDDVVREAGSEIMDSKEARKAIGARAAKLFKIFLAEKAWVPVVTLSEKGVGLEFVGIACPNAIGEPGVPGPPGEDNLHPPYTDYPHALCDKCGMRLGGEVLLGQESTPCGCGGTYHRVEGLKEQ